MNRTLDIVILAVIFSVVISVMKVLLGFETAVLSALVMIYATGQEKKK